MDRHLIEEKLEGLRRCIDRVIEKRPATAEVLAADLDLQDIITLNLTRAVQICVDIATYLIADSEASPPESMGEAFTSLVELGVIEPSLAQRMRNAVGFRNIAVHNYQAIDWEIVHSICHQDLSDFKNFARAIAEKL